MTMTALAEFIKEHDVELSKETLDLARMFPGQKVYCQGMDGGRCALWLQIGGGAHTMIGYGLPDQALEQAKAALDELHLQAQAGIEWFIKSRSERKEVDLKT